MFLLLALALVASGGPPWIMLAWLAWATRPASLARFVAWWRAARVGRRIP